MTIAGYTKKVQVSATGTSGWVDVPAENSSLERSGDVLDDTNLASPAAARGWRSRVLGLHDWSVSLGDCILSATAADNAALNLILQAWLDRSALYVQYLPTGATGAQLGVKGKCVVENYNTGGSVADKEMVNITLQADGATTIV